MKNAPLWKNRIKYIAEYLSVAVLLISLTVLGRKLDGAFFSQLRPFKPAEMAAETGMIVFAMLYVKKHHGSDLMKKIKKHLVYTLIPLAMVLTAFFCIPDGILPLSQNVIHILDVLLSSLSDDLVLCAVGCILLIHGGGLKNGGVVVMLLSMALYEIALTEETSVPFLLSIFAVVLIGFFEIQLHLSVESAIFCAVYHFLIHLCVKLPALNSARGGTVLGGAVSNAIYIAALIVMLAFGIVLYVKRRKKESADAAV